jgi:hypothetical protein
MTTTKRLGELRLNDTIYHDHHDLHSYGYHAPLYGLARFPASPFVPTRITDMVGLFMILFSPPVGHLVLQASA